jgi:hypothetical protein
VPFTAKGSEYPALAPPPGLCLVSSRGCESIPWGERAKLCEDHETETVKMDQIDELNSLCAALTEGKISEAEFRIAAMDRFGYDQVELQSCLKRIRRTRPSQPGQILPWGPTAREQS